VFVGVQVDDLKAKLASQEVELAQKNEDANKLIQVVGAEQEKVGKEKAIADEEEIKVSKITKEVEAKAADCARDLAKAEPALKAAVEALNTLNKVRRTLVAYTQVYYCHPVLFFSPSSSRYNHEQ
jgi:dynein heavy chain